uniref:Bet v I/Major latex protein domain-containing protein n=1 Tax=Fagus sylvatica TaxID=28930 RepID=A0A2N9HG67_FAGSY
MGVFTYESEVTSPIPPARLYKAFVLDADNLIPKILPHAIKSAEILEGNGGPGTIKKITFHEGYQFKFIKHKIDAIDKENYVYNYSVIEGSIFKSISKYHAKDDVEINEEQIKAGKEKASGLFKAVEGYLLANPEAYN